MKTQNEQLADFVGLSDRMWSYFKADERNLSYIAAKAIQVNTGIDHEFILAGPRANVVAEIVAKFKLFNEDK
jgi:hypothetical protein